MNFLKAPLSNLIGLLLVLVIAAGVLLGGSTSAPDLVTLGETNFGTVQVDDGSCSSPAYAYTSDTNTGLYRIGTDNMGWCAGGALALDVNANGTVDFAQAVTIPGITLTGDLTGTATLAGNPTMITNTMRIGATGLLFEGATADAIEGLLTVADPTSSDRTYTLPDASGTVVLTGQTGNVDSAMITNITRTVTLGLGGFQNLTASTAITWTSAADANPNFAAVNGSLAIAYDATGGSVDTALVGTSFSVPTDYASSGYFKVSVTQGAATVTNQESISCTTGIEGAAQGSAGTSNLVNQTAWQSVTVVPAGTYAAGDSVGLVCKQANASADDTVNILSIQFEYLATE